MDILQKNVFYLGLAALLGVYLVVYFVLIAPMQGTIKKETAKLNKSLSQTGEYLSKKNLANDEVVKYHEERKNLLNESLQKVMAFHAERDKELEKWFPDIEDKLQKAQSKVPELDFFQAVYSRERQELINKYSDPKYPLRIQKRSDFTSIDLNTQERAQEVQDVLPLVIPTKIVTESDMKRVQKQFWLLQGMLGILEQGKMKAMNNYKFQKPREERLGEGNEEVSFTIHTVEISGTIEYAVVPALVNELLNNKKKLMVQIGRISIQRDKTYRAPTHTIEVMQGETEKDAMERWRQKQGKEEIPTVNITIVCGILDYDEKKQ